MIHTTPAMQAREDRNRLFEDLGLAGKEDVKEKDDARGQEAFMRLFLAQIKHQDPLEPQDNSAFVAQLAQFAQLEGTNDMKDTMEKMLESLKSSRVLEATSLVGKKIDVESNKVNLRESGRNEDGSPNFETVKGKVLIPQVVLSEGNGDKINEFQQVELQILSPHGKLIDTVNMGKSFGSEAKSFSWNGKDKEGNAFILPETKEAITSGEYKIKARAKVNDAWQDLDTVVVSKINSVSLNADEIEVSAEGVGALSLSELQKIYD